MDQELKQKESLRSVIANSVIDVLRMATDLLDDEDISHNASDGECILAIDLLRVVTRYLLDTQDSYHEKEKSTIALKSAPKLWCDPGKASEWVDALRSGTAQGKCLDRIIDDFSNEKLLNFSQVFSGSEDARYKRKSWCPRGYSIFVSRDGFIRAESLFWPWKPTQEDITANDWIRISDTW